MNTPEENIKYFEQQAKGGFTLPEQYFENSKQQLLQRINQGGFTTPDNYFEEAKANLLKQVTKPNKRFMLTFWKQAAAVLLVSIGLYWFYSTPTATNIADLNEEEIIHYVDLTGIDDHALVLFQPDELSIKTEHEEEMIYQIEEELIVNEL
ncbi:MAG: hypothetical protein EAY81_01285 [Bacteroidetes bacterium]|nr:MAG: hypothetical protein EAY81_01285 [Bacteroidota bacterium]